jgi:hypothetical protein
MNHKTRSIGKNANLRLNIMIALPLELNVNAQLNLNTCFTPQAVIHLNKLKVCTEPADQKLTGGI